MAHDLTKSNAPAPLPRFEFMAALLMGVLLLVIAVPAISYSWMPVAFSSAILAVSISLVLYAFGSFVRVSLHWLVATGCAAVMFGTYELINQQHAKEIVEVFIEAPGQKFWQPRASIGSHELFGALTSPSYDEAVKREVSHQFTIILRAGRDLTSGRSNMNLSLFFAGAQEAIEFLKIPTDHLYKALGSGEEVHWLIRDRTKLYVLEGKNETLIADIQDPTVARKQTFWVPPTLISKAWAQDTLRCDEVTKFAADYTSPDPETRRASRDASGKLGPCIVKPLMSLYDMSRGKYQIVLGIVVALEKMLDEYKDQRKAVEGSLTQDNINELIKLSIHDDRTIRSYAGTFMYDLASPRALTPLLDTSRQIQQLGFSDKNAAFNMVLIASEMYQYLDRASREQLSQFFGQWKGRVDPKTDSLIAKLR
jgi:hypothetical protein